MADRNVRIVKKGGKKPVHATLPKTASTLFDKNSLVEFAAGVINPSDDNDTKVFGIIKQEVAAADSDYATTGAKTVEVIHPGDEIEITTSGAATVGTSYGISNAYTVDITDTTNKVFTVTAVISSTRARGFMQTYSSSF